MSSDTFSGRGVSASFLAKDYKRVFCSFLFSPYISFFFPSFLNNYCHEGLAISYTTYPSLSFSSLSSSFCILMTPTTITTTYHYYHHGHLFMIYGRGDDLLVEKSVIYSLIFVVVVFLLCSVLRLMWRRRFSLASLDGKCASVVMEMCNCTIYHLSFVMIRTCADLLMS